MTTKTPAEIAESTVPFDGSKPTDRAPLTWAEVQALVVEAIEADRAQRDTDVIARKVWMLEDFESYWDTHYADNYSISPERVEKIIESAPNYLYRAALEDCTDAEWDAIDEALRSSIQAELGEAAL